jgi:hypothetical protein
MPADREELLLLGRGGLNLREQPAEVGQSELVDSLNWQLDQNGALTKRLGTIAWASQNAANILALYTYTPSGASPTLVAHFDDGSVQTTQIGDTWTTIDTGLSTNHPIGFVQYLDKAYWGDGTNAMRQWDGVTLTLLPTADTDDVQTVTITGTPTGGTFTLTLDGQTTSALAYNASAGNVQSALEALTNIGTGNVLCSGGALPGTGVVCTFRAGMSFRPVDLITHTDSLTGGSSPAVHVTHTTQGAAAVPPGRLVTIFRNRLWIAYGRTVEWSAAGDPTNFTSQLNFVTFPDDTDITALIKAPNFVYHRVLYDGVLVFTQHRTHRIVDDSDNLAGVVTGGSNVIVDTSQGCLGQRSAVEMNGLIYLVGRGGVYTTNGYGPCEKQSLKIQPLLNQVQQGQELTVSACQWQGRYLLAYTPVGATGNTLLLELNTDLPADGGQHPWMAHSIGVNAMTVLPTSAGDILLYADSSVGDEGYVRRMWTGATDVDGDSDALPIIAKCRSGAQLLGVNGRKRLRYVQAYGSGKIQLSASSDFVTASGEPKILDMSDTGGSVWNSFNWNEGLWGPTSNAKTARAYFTQTLGRFLTFELAEAGEQQRAGPTVLGVPGTEIGGAAIYGLNVRIIPLDPS